MSTNRYRAEVWDRGTKKPAGTVIVEAFDLSRRVTDMVATGTTDRHGIVEITVPEETILKLFGTNPAILYFRVISVLNVVGSTEQTNRWDARTNGSGRIEVDAARPVAVIPGASYNPTYVIDGKLIDGATGEPMAARTIRVSRRTITPGLVALSVPELTSTTTAAGNGSFRASYFAPEPRPDIVVQAIDSDGVTKLAELKINAARPREFRDLVVGAAEDERNPGRTQFAFGLESLAALNRTVTIDTYTAAQIEFAVARTRLDQDQVINLVDARKLAASTPLGTQLTDTAAEIYYALVERGVGRTADEIFSNPLPLLRRELEEAASRRLIAPARVAPANVTSLMTDLEACALQVLRINNDTKTRIGHLVDLVPVTGLPSTNPTPAQSATNFLKLLVNFEGTPDEFWTLVVDPYATVGTNAISTEAKARYRFVAEAMVITGGFRAAAMQLVQALPTTVATDPKALALLAPTAWTFVTTFPAPYTLTTYREFLAASAEARFRTAALRGRLATTGDAGLCRNFLQNNPNFEFETARFSQYAAGLGLASDTKAAMKTLERRFQLTESLAEVSLLETAGYASAAAIHADGYAKFSSTLGAGVSDTIKQSIFNKACWAATTAPLTLSTFSPKFNRHSLGGMLPGFRSSASPPTPIADWDELFGSADSCACEHCSSVLSPAAYLVDVLQTLGRVKKTSGVETARSELFLRRPDIPRLALSCTNATSPMPYVDIVNEIMEVRLQQPTGSWTWPASPVQVQTPEPGDHLMAHPETVYVSEHLAAYTALEASRHPLRNPFHLWLEEARIYLDYLGVSRDRLLELFVLEGSSPDVRLLATERLRTTTRSYDFIAATAVPIAGEAETYWGLSSTYLTDLRKVKTLMEKGELSFEQVRELLTTQVWTSPPPAAPTVVFTSSSCDLEVLEITQLTAAQAHRLNRFLRLWKTTNWSITKLWNMLAIHSDALDATLLFTVGALTELERRLGVDAEVATTWFAPTIDRNSSWQPSLYRRTFLDPRLGTGRKPFSDLELATGTTSTTYAEARDALGAALQVSDADLMVLTDTTAATAQLGLSPEQAPGAMTVIGLSALYRAVTLARATKLSVQATQVLRAFHGTPIFGTGGSSEVMRYLRTLDRFTRAGLSIDELQYVLRNLTRETSEVVAPEPALLDASDAELVLELEKARGEATQVSDSDGSLIVSLGKQVLSLSHQAELLQLAENPANATNSTFLTTIFSPFLRNLSEAQTLLVGANQLTSVPERRTYLARQLSDYLNRRAAALVWAANLSGLSLDTTAFLLGRPRAQDVGPEVSILSRGAATPVARLRQLMDPAPATKAERLKVARVLVRVGLLLRKLRLDERDLEYLHDLDGEPRAVTGTLFLLRALDFDSVGSVSASAFEGLLSWADLVWARDRWGTGAAALYQYLDDVALTTVDQAVARIAKENGFNDEDVKTIGLRMGFSTASSLRSVVAVRRIFEGMEVLRRLGVAATLVVGPNGLTGVAERGWLAVDAPLPNPGADVEAPSQNALVIARQMKAAARARCGEEAWSTTGKAVRDPLREKQRKALVAALLTKLSLKDAGELYDNLLIDVEMSPCLQTSRLVCAHGSVQTFTNRIQLNLESSKNLAPTAQLSREWDWMHAYRLWEANRKVFLWPENWIEPELRDTKTPLFESLEQSLLQGPLDSVTAEKAYRTYLDELAEVANLELVAVHQEKLEGGGTKVHVIGRTNKPYRYYHRFKGTEGWSPWKKVDADIQGEHVVAVTVSGVLYLLWFLIEDEPRLPVGTFADSGEEPALPEALAALDEQMKANPDLFFEPFKSHFRRMIDEAKMKSQLQDFAEALKPTPLAGKVSVSVAELRQGEWSTLTSGSDYVPLAASPSRVASSFRAYADEGTIVARMSHGFDPRRDCAEFRFDVGSRRVAAKRGKDIATLGGELVDPTNVYASDTLCRVTSPLSSNARPVDFNANGPAEFQRFSADYKAVNVFDQKLGGPTPLLTVTTPMTTRVLIPRNSTSRDIPILVVQDRARSLLASRRKSYIKASSAELQVGMLYGGTSASTGEPKKTYDKYDLELLYHPFVNEFRKRLALRGVDGLLRVRDIDQPPQFLETSLATLYSAKSITTGLPKETVDFEPGSAYGMYNWEIFFHAPFLIANRLRQEGRYAEARDWYHTIFNPTDGAAVPNSDTHTRFWKFRPFIENPDLATIQAQLTTLATPSAKYLNGLMSKGVANLSFAQQITKWRNDPFDPHAIASLRRVAYQKAVVLKYIENLLAWGDDLFTQDTMETVNEAAQLYVHALKLLGRRPQVIPAPNGPTIKSYTQLGTDIDLFGNAFIEQEVLASAAPEGGVPCTGSQPALGASLAGETYFCVPENDKLLGLWDTVEDRLFKIRNCQNIEGVLRQLPLFEPPIDPALLVRARAAGLDLNSVLREVNVSTTPYRYSVLAARAIEYTSALTSLGSTLLSALEKKDGEELALLRSKHDIASQEQSREIRKSQLAEARENLASLVQSRKLAVARRDYYESRPFLSPGETAALALGDVAAGLSVAANLIKAGGAAVSAGPDTIIGVAGTMGTPLAAIKIGAENPSRASIGAGDAMEAASRAVAQAGSDAGTLASYQRRYEDWQFQASQAELELAQLDKQILAAEIRTAMAQQELRLLELNMRQSKEIERHLRTKFTSQELYGWMVGQLSAVYHQSYKLAYEMARQAERAFQHERGDTSQTFIKFGAWDGFRKGLLAGEKLGTDLRRMDAAYHTQNKREHELVKTISIAQLDPDAFMKLREAVVNGAEFTLPMSLFDDDFPTHHMRRLKSVNVSLQCTPGPYQSVNGSLTLWKSETLLKPTDTSATQDNAGVALIATSGAANDTGLFELNFRDERYLPFEYRGVHSQTGPQWRFELTGGNEFNYDSITDLVMQLRYTAREGRVGTVPITTSKKLLWRIPQTNPDAWAAFKEGSSSSLVLKTTDSTFTRGKGRTLGNVTEVKLYARTNSALTLALAEAAVSAQPDINLLKVFKTGAFTLSATANRDWTITLSAGVVSGLTDLWVAFTYSLS